MGTASTVLIMGPPGAGKGTQAAHLVNTYALRHVATGDLLRAAVAAGSELGMLAQGYMESGQLVPDDVTIGLLRELVRSLAPDEGVLLDGFPRTVAQAEALAHMLDELGRSVDVALDIRVPDSVLVERLSGRWICRSCGTPFNVNSKPPRMPGKCDACGGELYQRADDTATAVMQRLGVYAQQTAPVSQWYATQGVLATIDGNQSPESVQAALDVVMQG
jgi:adenylate kinase